MITNDTVLDGTGHEVTIACASPPGAFGGTNRIFYVCSNVTFTAINVTMANGSARTFDPFGSPAGVSGGAILNDGGVLNLRNVSFLTNWAMVGGGALASRNGGTANASNCTFAGNSVGGLFQNGAPAYGGAILNEGGQMSLRACVLRGNSALAGYSDMTRDGFGGAIQNEGNLTVSDCLFRDNAVTGGAGFTVYQQMGVSGFPGGSGFGGAICNLGTLVLSSSTVMSNSASGGGGGRGNPGGVDGHTGMPVDSGGGGSGGPGYGGGLFNGGTASLINSTLGGNLGAGGGGGSGGPPITVYVWVSWKQAYEEDTIPAAPNGASGSGFGGIYSTNAALRLTNCTVAFNTASGGTDYWTRVVAGVSVTGAFMVNTLLASNSPGGNASGPIVDGGHNLSSDASCAFTDPTSLSNTDPLLGPLADNGGPTLTMALLAGSPAIGAADSASAPPTDQRGFPRPTGSADIGACEFGYPPILAAGRPPEGGVDLSVSGRAGQVCRLLASPNLVNWTAIATNSFSSSGRFLFHDPAGAGQGQRFYRAVMPLTGVHRHAALTIVTL